MKEDGTNQTVYGAGRSVKPRHDLQAAARTFNDFPDNKQERLLQFCSLANHRCELFSLL